MTYSLSQCEDRFRNDPVFAQVVGVLESIIMKLQMTPGEIRDACSFAALRCESRISKTTDPIFLEAIERAQAQAKKNMEDDVKFKEAASQEEK